MGARLIAINFDVVPTRLAEQPHHAARVKGFLGAEFVEHVVSVFKQALRLFADNLIFRGCADICLPATGS